MVETIARPIGAVVLRSEEHTSELQSHSEISYAVFCLKKKKMTVAKGTPQRICLLIGRLIYYTQLLLYYSVYFFFFNDTATTEIYTLSYTLSLHDALPISSHIQKSRMPSSACD